MKKIILKIICSSFLLFLFIGCSDNNPGPSNDASVSFFAELTSPNIKPLLIKNSYQIEKSFIDSIQISKLRILVSELKLFSDKDDSTSSGKMIKAEPFVISLDSTGQIVEISSNTSVNVGVFEKIKFEIHRLSTSDLSKYANDLIFEPFATQDRFSIIIDGKVYVQGNQSHFSYKSNLTTNLLLKIEPGIILTANTSAKISIQINPTAIFKTNNDIIDPREVKNFSFIDNAIKLSIKAIKK